MAEAAIIQNRKSLPTPSNKISSLNHKEDIEFIKLGDKARRSLPVQEVPIRSETQVVVDLAGQDSEFMVRDRSSETNSQYEITGEKLEFMKEYLCSQMDIPEDLEGIMCDEATKKEIDRLYEVFGFQPQVVPDPEADSRRKKKPKKKKKLQEKETSSALQVPRKKTLQLKKEAVSPIQEPNQHNQVDQRRAPGRGDDSLLLEHFNQLAEDNYSYGVTVSGSSKKANENQRETSSPKIKYRKGAPSFVPDTFEVDTGLDKVKTGDKKDHKRKDSKGK